ncbi:MAG: hypothetical protein AABX50_02370 [Nanoarchaeota archaeon]
MKIKTAGRIEGAIRSGVFITTGYFLYNTLSMLDYNKLINELVSDKPI